MQTMSLLSGLGRHSDAFTGVESAAHHGAPLPAPMPLKDVPAAVVLSLLGVLAPAKRSSHH